VVVKVKPKPADEPIGWPPIGFERLPWRMRGRASSRADRIAALFDSSTGVPRRLNRIASAAMIVAASRKKNIVSAQDVHDARVDRGRA
jgi:hypothetical protein